MRTSAIGYSGVDGWKKDIGEGFSMEDPHFPSLSIFLYFFVSSFL